MQQICRDSIEIRCPVRHFGGVRNVKVISCADRWNLLKFWDSLIQLMGVERPIWRHLKAWAGKQTSSMFHMPAVLVMLFYHWLLGSCILRTWYISILVLPFEKIWQRVERGVAAPCSLGWTTWKRLLRRNSWTWQLWKPGFRIAHYHVSMGIMSCDESSWILFIYNNL